MPGYYYHCTTVAGYNAIISDGYIRPQDGNTYKGKIFLANNDQFARRVTFIKHAQFEQQTLVVFKIPKYCLKQRYLSDGSRHTGLNAPGDRTYTYSQPIAITDDVLMAAEPYALCLPEGVSIARDGKKTGLAFTPEAAKRFGIEHNLEYNAQSA
jgi:hypothetical protein